VERTEQFQWLFVTEYPTVVRTLSLLLHDRSAAEDIAEDAFVQLLRKWDKVRDYESPGAWVRRVAIRMAVRHERRERQRRLLSLSAAEPSPRTTPPADAGVDHELLDVVRRLPARQRTAVVLFYFEDRPMEEIAEIMGCSPSTGWVHLHKARARLVDLLDEEVGSDVG